MKLNCDLGESFGTWQKGADKQIMPFIDLANIACGFHASDPLTMQKTVKLAIQHNVIIGAHPSYPDLLGFGRRSMLLSDDELTAIIHYQLGALQGICTSENSQICYVKPHGALYNDMMKNEHLFLIVCSTIAQFNPSLPLIMQALPDPLPFQTIAKKYGITLWFEAFADRAYNDDGSLVSREHNNAVIDNTKQVLDRCRHLLKHKQLLSITGKPLNLHVDTLCVHGDNPAAVELVEQLKRLISSK